MSRIIDCHCHIYPDKIAERAKAYGCKAVQFFKPYFDQSTIDKAKAAGLRINVYYANTPEEAVKYFEMGVDTVLTDEYLSVAEGTGIR